MNLPRGPALGNQAPPLALAPRDMIWCFRKVGGGRAPRQPGQVRKEAAVTGSCSGHLPAFHLFRETAPRHGFRYVRLTASRAWR